MIEIQNELNLLKLLYGFKWVMENSHEANDPPFVILFTILATTKKVFEGFSYMTARTKFMRHMEKYSRICFNH
ncbi:CLUMA_CG002455, isoform A [Clunio marinus]|uniref:CLUMA_CG002455, isoform A n=1 Tax=Clunio marinus TaxID=568069 RepID=A0A1J1HQY2_9DIPT|nr:CLUMA_CG002455, isoform A [Clunio marinus]